MNKEINRQAEKMNSKHRLRQRWYKILAVPACIVVFITTYAMILPAITMESTPDAYCGQKEHVHTDVCYEIPGVPEYVRLDCPLLKEIQMAGMQQVQVVPLELLLPPPRKLPTGMWRRMQPALSLSASIGRKLTALSNMKTAVIPIQLK